MQNKGITLTFLSDARQPEVDFLHSSAVILNKFLRKTSKSKDTYNINLVASRYQLKEKNAHFRLTCEYHVKMPLKGFHLNGHIK